MKLPKSNAAITNRRFADLLLMSSAIPITIKDTARVAAPMKNAKNWYCINSSMPVKYPIVYLAIFT